eukprot:3575891-Amphidinium_carterae.2
MGMLRRLLHQSHNLPAPRNVQLNRRSNCATNNKRSNRCSVRTATGHTWIQYGAQLSYITLHYIGADHCNVRVRLAPDSIPDPESVKCNKSHDSFPKCFSVEYALNCSHSQSNVCAQLHCLCSLKFVALLWCSLNGPPHLVPSLLSFEMWHLHKDPVCPYPWGGAAQPMPPGMAIFESSIPYFSFRCQKCLATFIGRAATQGMCKRCNLSLDLLSTELHAQFLAESRVRCWRRGFRWLGTT